MNFLDLIWLIPLFPLAGAVIMLLLGRRFDPQPAHSPLAMAAGLNLSAANSLGDHGHGAHSAAPAQGHHDSHAHPSSPLKFLVSILCPGMVLLSLLFSLGAIVQLAAKTDRVHQVILYTWLAGFPFAGEGGAMYRFAADCGFLLDPLSSVMIFVVSGVGFLIHVYSIGYMAHDGGYYRFFGYLNLFVFFMLTLVLANNFVLLFVGWEGVGLCSYLLIGFYFHKKSASDAGIKAFLVNRIGDAGFILGILLTFAVFGTVRFVDLNAAIARGGFAPEVAGFGVLSLIGILLFIGATGKSAQIPLYVWLPDAMEGPTPVSALIHAATMVTAGVYMVARSGAIYALAPDVLHIVAIVGAATAIFAASIALVQNDIKRVLAYSTVSQLGYMFLALGVGAYWVAIFHLFTHAFFKALLFLGSGSVIHAMGGEQDMRRMGGLRDKIPVTYWTMLIGTLAIAGIPGLAGFFSKDEILWQAYSSPLGATYLYAIGILTAAMTAFYMGRLLFMTFFGAPRMTAEQAAHIHESPPVMTIPLALLAAGSVLAGWLAVPKVWTFLGDSFRVFEHWLEPALAHATAHAAEEHHGAHDTALELLLMAASVAIAIAGLALAWRLYGRRREPAEGLLPAVPDNALVRTLENKWYIDEIYNFLFVNGLSKGGGSAMARFDNAIVDGGVNGAGWLTRFTSTISIWWDTWIVDGAVRLTAFLVKMASYPVRVLQTGHVQSYALVFALGILLFFGYYLAR